MATDRKVSKAQDRFVAAVFGTSGDGGKATAGGAGRFFSSAGKHRTGGASAFFKNAAERARGLVRRRDRDAANVSRQAAGAFFGDEPAWYAEDDRDRAEIERRRRDRAAGELFTPRGR